MRESVESRADLKDANIDIVRITKCPCDEKCSLIAFKNIFGKNKDTQI